MSEPTLKFANEFVEPILAGEKTATIRYGTSAEGLSAGNILELLDEDGSPIGRARVTTVAHLPAHGAREYVESERVGHRTYETVDEFLEQLSAFYPDASLEPGTEVTLVEWNRFKPAPEWAPVKREGSR